MAGSTPSFEVQLYRKGRWETESSYATLPEAESAAKSLQSPGGRVEGVRIVREIFEPTTNRFATAIVSRWHKGEEEQREAARLAKEKNERAETVLARARAARVAAERERLARRGAWIPRAPFWFWPLVGGVASAVVGVGILIALHFLLYGS
jgi:signal transduction histidine kinase